MSKMCYRAIAAIIAVTGAAFAEDKAPPPADQGFPPRMSMPAEALKQFDKDGDGKLNDQERAAMMEARKAMGAKLRQAREKEFDKNGDGKLDDAEKAAMLEANKAQREQFMKARFKEFDKNGDGKLDDAEKAAMMESIKQRHPEAGPKLQELMKRFDKDGDGKLNDEERKAMMEERAKHMQERNGAKPPADNAPKKPATP